ncbi:MAG: TRAP transporter substrate-binding protein DctP [Hahellaceae bacterium]|nr:TRAP transporter substrate-binding protein DctP [Hahellaceae bacterium]MCP5170425.1 TRAP transporter substrate-binding protein DctP [Hahellaceae bacterium]
MIFSQRKPQSLFLLALCFWATGLSAASTEAPSSDRSLVADWLANRSPRYHQDAPAIQWKFAHPAPPVSMLPPLWQSGFDWLQAVTGQAIEIKQYGGGTLYGYVGGAKAIRAGIADEGTCYSMTEAKGFELTRTFQLPYVAPANPYLNARVINELTATTLKQEFTKRGVYPGHIIPSRPLTLMSKTPIRVPADLRGKKVVSFITAPGAAEALGYSEVRLPFPEIYTALQQGIVDAVIWVDMGFIPYKIYEQAKYYTELNIAPSTIETCINRQSFDRLPDGLKRPVYEVQQKMVLAVIDQMEAFSEQAMHTLEQNHVTRISLDDQVRTQWKAAFMPVTEQWLNQCEKAGKDCRKLVDDIQRLTKKYSALSNRELTRLGLEAPVQGMIDF